MRPRTQHNERNHFVKDLTNIIRYIQIQRRKLKKDTDKIKRNHLTSPPAPIKLETKVKIQKHYKLFQKKYKQNI